MKPPAAARALVRLFSDPADRAFLLEDLTDRFREVARTEGLRAAKRWYWLQALSVVPWALPPDGHLIRRQSGQGVVGDLRFTTRGTMKMTGLWNDARFALRGLFRAPGFTLITIGTLALGIGATTAIFTVVNGVLLKPLPFEDPDELVAVWNRTETGDGFGLSLTQHFTYQDENRVFEAIGNYQVSQRAVTGLGEPEQLPVMRVTAGLLPLLRVQPVIGRRFT